jgi:hypothetical protein
VQSKGAMRAVAAAGACAILGGCAISPHDGRTSYATPKHISAVYSQFNMKMRLLMTADAPRQQEECSGQDCFDRRVAELGPKIADAAFEAYPEFGCQVENLDFVIADKKEPATLSTALGRVVVFRPVEHLAHTDAALAFILAREVGHIIAQHHERNAAYGIFVSGIAHLLLPVTTLAKAFSEAFAGASAGAAATASVSATVAANASVSATTMVGSQVAVETQARPQQDEADDIAMRILDRLGYDGLRIRQSFGKAEPKPVNEWVAALHGSIDRLTHFPEYERNAEFIQVAARTDADAPACRFDRKPEPLILGML